MKDLYQVLGVERAADAKEIKKAYRALTQKFHPDKNPGDKKAEDRFKDVSGAYEVLGDEAKRKAYDEFGELSLTQGFDPERARAYQRQRTGARTGDGFDYSFSSFGDAQETSFDDLLSRLFGGGRIRDVDDLLGRSTGPKRARRGADLTGEIAVGLLDALRGTTVPLRIDGGEGEPRTLDVKIPPGVSEGDKLRLRGQGGQGSPAGDVILTVHVKPHPRLAREGANLRLLLPVTAHEAYRGGPVDVPTPWGTVTLKLPPGSQNGQVLRVRGKGVHPPGGPDGDLLVALDVRMPPGGDARLLEALEALQAKVHVRADLKL